MWLAVPPKLRLDIKFPPDLLQQLRGEMHRAWWNGVSQGFAYGILAVMALALLVSLWRSPMREKMQSLLIAGCMVAAGYLLWVSVKPPTEPAPDPNPVPLPAPNTPAPVRPCPPDRPCPNPRPWGPDQRGPVGPSGLLAGPFAPVGKPTLGGQVGPGGQEVQVDLPLSQRIRNIGSHVDGAGMCVSTSMTHAARWHNLRDWYNWRDWCAKFPGGGYPSKMDKQIRQYAQEKNIPVPAYLQYEGHDPRLLEEALKNEILPSVTYAGRDGVRYRESIAHMVNLVYLDASSAGIMDNNGKPEDLIWMTRQEFLDRWTGGKSGWAHFWLLPGPPPPPHNLPGKDLAVRGPGAELLTPFLSFLPAQNAPTGGKPCVGEEVWIWKEVPGEEGEARLMRNGHQVGTYSARKDWYKEWDYERKAWGAVKTPPIAVPAHLKAMAARLGMSVPEKPRNLPPGPLPQPGPPFIPGPPLVPPEPPMPQDRVKTLQGEIVPTGVFWDQIKEKESFFLSGKEVERQEAFAVIGEGMPDFSKKLRLTVIGSPEQRSRVVADFPKSHLAQTAILQDYDPTDSRESWALECGFKRDGFQLYLQTPQGAVLGRADRYEGPETLRKIDPAYDPTKDPDPSKAKIRLPGVPGPLQNVPWSAYVVALIGGGAALMNRKRGVSES